jgi:hypothetical protein
VQESYAKYSTDYTWRKKINTVVVGGFHPFGTLPDDPGKPMHKDAVVGRAKEIFGKDPLRAVGEIGLVSP